MIRIVLVLLFIITIFLALVLFPSIANQPVRIELLGWLFETRTGMFTLLMLLIIGSIWALQKAFDLGVNSPRQIWLNLRGGNKRRREIRLKEALATWVDEGEGYNLKLLKRSKGVLPDWFFESLIIWWNPISKHLKINDEKDSPSIIALKARLATDASHVKTLSLSERQHFLDAWLSVHPAAPLALERKAMLLGDLGEYAEQVHFLEDLIQKNKTIESLKPLLSRALFALAEKDKVNKIAHLRKANRLQPTDAEILKALAFSFKSSGDPASAERLLLDYLLQNNSFMIAEAAFEMLKAEPLKNFKRVDTPSYQKLSASAWLRIMLAYAADLTGLAEDGIHALIEKEPTALLWKTQGDWAAQKSEWELAAKFYKKAISCG